MYRLVSVKFANSNRRYDYLCDFDDVRRGDVVRVLTPRGEQLVEVMKVYWCDKEDLELPFDRYKHILGKVEAANEDAAESESPAYNPQNAEPSAYITKAPELIRAVYAEGGNVLTDAVLQKLYDVAGAYFSKENWLEAEAAYNAILEICPNDRGCRKGLVTIAYLNRTNKEDSSILLYIGQEYVKQLRELSEATNMTKAEKEIDAFDYLRNSCAFVLKELESFGLAIEGIVLRRNIQELENRLAVVMTCIENYYNVGKAILQYFGYHKMLRKYVGFFMDTFLPVYIGVYKLNTGKFINRYKVELVKQRVLDMGEIVKKYNMEETSLAALCSKILGLFKKQEEQKDFEGWTKEDREQLLKDISSDEVKKGMQEVAPTLQNFYDMLNKEATYRPQTSAGNSSASYTNAAYMGGAAALAASGSLAQSNTEDVSDYELMTNPKYWWHPMNVFYDEDRKPEFDKNRVTDEHGWTINGKWVAEHERNQSNPGSLYDSRGYAKDPYYESFLKYNDFPEDDPRYMTDEQYVEYEAQQNDDYYVSQSGYGNDDYDSDDDYGSNSDYGNDDYDNDDYGSDDDYGNDDDYDSDDDYE